LMQTMAMAIQSPVCSKVELPRLFLPQRAVEVFHVRIDADDSDDDYQISTTDRQILAPAVGTALGGLKFVYAGGCRLPIVGKVARFGVAATDAWISRVSPWAGCAEVGEQLDSLAAYIDREVLSPRSAGPGRRVFALQATNHSEFMSPVGSRGLEPLPICKPHDIKYHFIGTDDDDSDSCCSCGSSQGESSAGSTWSGWSGPGALETDDISILVPAVGTALDGLKKAYSGSCRLPVVGKVARLSVAATDACLSRVSPWSGCAEVGEQLDSLAAYLDKEVPRRVPRRWSAAGRWSMGAANPAVI